MTEYDLVCELIRDIDFRISTKDSHYFSLEKHGDALTLKTIIEVFATRIVNLENRIERLSKETGVTP